MNEIVQKALGRIQDAVRRSDGESVERLQQALGPHLSSSLYAGLPQQSVLELQDHAGQALATIKGEQRALKASRPPRVRQARTEREVVTLDQEQLELLPMMPRVLACRESKSAPPVYRRCTPRTLRKYPYLRINPPQLVMWMPFDIDRAGAALAWESAGLPPPAAAVTNRLNGHAHLLYPLTAPVLTGDAARGAPLRYLAAIEHAFRSKLDADPAFSHNFSVKNPMHAGWDVLYGPAHTWQLGELAKFVDLPKFLPKAGYKVENVGLGRNCTLFDRLRLWAYKEIRKFWGQQHGYVFWSQHVFGQASLMNGDLGDAGSTWNSLSGPMSDNEVFHIAKHVSKFVWKNFDPDTYKAYVSKVQSNRRAKQNTEVASSIKELKQWARSTPENDR